MRPQRRRRLRVEQLEERCVPSYLVESYGPAALATNSASVTGVHAPLIPFYPQNEDGVTWSLSLTPDPPQEVQAFTEAEYAALTARYPTWTFSSSVNTLADNTLQVKHYDVAASLPGPLQTVHAEIFIATNNLNQIAQADLHWIQVVTAVAPVGFEPDYPHNPFVDTPKLATPYYDRAYVPASTVADHSGATDRTNYPYNQLPGNHEYDWSAALFVVEEIGGKAVRIWQGVRWGWQTRRDTVSAQNDFVAVLPNATLNVAAPGVLANDTDDDEDPLTAILVATASNGAVTLNSNGSFAYIPNSGFSGTDTFQYKASDGVNESILATVTIDVASAPVARGDTYQILHDQTFDLSELGVLKNDTASSGNALSAVLVTGPGAGTLALNADGSFSYEPNSAFVGTDSFQYKVNDGVQNSDTATVTITVVNAAPLAADDSYSVVHNDTLSVLANQEPFGLLYRDHEPDGDELTVTQVNGSAANVGTAITLNSGATLTVEEDGSFTYEPATGWTGDDSFTYTASDGLADSTATVYIEVTNHAALAIANVYLVVPDAPYSVSAPGVLGDDSDPDGDPLTAVLVSGPSHGSLTLNSNGSFTYTPNTGYTGTDSFSYKANDAFVDSNAVTVSLTVSGTPLLFPGSPSATDEVASLTTADLGPIVLEAARRWVTASSDGMVQAQLNTVQIHIADLGGSYLGMSAGNTIWIDVNGAGYGWFIDRTPGNDEEYSGPAGAQELHALDGTVAAKRIDLLTVVMHEMGHALGLGHSHEGVMQEFLQQGIRHALGCGCTACTEAVQLAHGAASLVVLTPNSAVASASGLQQAIFAGVFDLDTGFSIFSPASLSGPFGEQGFLPYLLESAPTLEFAGFSREEYTLDGLGGADGEDAVLVGGDGNDIVCGEFGRDVLVGGFH